jgi:hypothetical protein
MRSSRRNNAEGHISVHWLDTPVPPTRWEQLDQRWTNLPAAIVVMVVVFAIIVPWSLIPVSNLSQVSVSLPSLTRTDGGETASPVPPTETEATPVGGEATPLPLPPSLVLPQGATTARTTVAATASGYVLIIPAHPFGAIANADARNSPVGHAQADRPPSQV